MLQEELTQELSALAAELDALGAEENYTSPQIPGFAVQELIGVGGMGKVWRAEQISLDRAVALKIVANASAGFSEEARALARLHHPNIVHVHEAGKDWFAMELVEGESAARHVFSSVEEVAKLGVAVSEALAYAHRCNVLHRDIKPSNIFIGEDGTVKLGDFGLEQEGFGTRRYMAPELLAGDKATVLSDIYALGATLQELVAGLPAKKDFSAIVAKAMHQKPEARYADVEAMLLDLRRFLSHEPVSANPPSVLRRAKLFAKRNPVAAFALLALFAALSIGYLRTSIALAETHKEATKAAKSLADALTNVRREERDPRDAELERAETIVESLLARFPEDVTILEARERIRRARQLHSLLPKRRKTGL